MSIHVGIDIGTTKVCTIVAREEGDGRMRILGVGIEPSLGIRKGTVVDIAAATKAVGFSIEKAERTAGYEINSARVSLAGSHVSSINSRGVASVHNQVIDEDDVLRAMDAAKAVAIPHNREVIEIIQRGFTVDGQDGIRMPIGMHGYRMEVEAHIITAAASTVDNLRQVVGNSGVEVSGFVLNPLASGEVVLTDTEREMGVVICDIGGGTTDMAIYIEGDVWHTMVLGVGGNHITSDIAHGLRLPFTRAEEVKINHGHAVTGAVRPDEVFPVRTFGEEEPVEVSRFDLAHIIEARVEEIFALMVQEIKRSGYDGLLPAGLVLTGGSSQLTGIRELASEVMGLPCRVARPENLIGMVDRLHSPSFSTSVGLVKYAMQMKAVDPTAVVMPKYVPEMRSPINWARIKEVLKRILP
jgi:cell division protein FtsA